jgi:non-ribosomal peptide synthetase component F
MHPLLALDRCRHEVPGQYLPWPEFHWKQLRDAQSNVHTRTSERVWASSPTPNTAMSHCRKAVLPAALLAVSLIGGVYIPLDPLYPAERCALMMEDAGAHALITAPGVAPAFMSRLADDVCVIELNIEAMAAAVEAARKGGVDYPEEEETDLAYCIFTSGSTGRPKGVPIYQSALMNLLESFRLEVRA